MSLWLYAGFVAFVLVMLALDLFVVNRKAHVVRTREALAWTGVCVALALAFNAAVYYIYEHDWMGIGTKFVDTMERADAQRDRAQPAELPPVASEAPAPDGENAALREARKSPGRTAAVQFLTGWLTEYSLSLDNIFVIALIFAHFRVPAQFQHRVLFWGILGALVLRGLLIWIGAELVERFHWIMYVFGALLIFTAIKMVRSGESSFDPEKSLAVRLGRRVFTVSPSYEGERFFTTLNGRRAVTPLFLVLLVVEATDVIFAVDSIPAIFGITRDPFIVFTSNVFAILGLRSLYFALAGLMEKFKHLSFSLAFILAFVGVKMLLEFWHVEIPATASLGVIAAALAAGVGTSLLWAPRMPPAPDAVSPAEEAARDAHAG